MTQQPVIALVGMPGAGKGTCTKYMHEHFGWPLIHFGNMVYDEVQRRGLDNVKDEKFVREDMRAQEGKAVLAKHAARRADQHFAHGAAAVVLDGLYSWSELKYLSEHFGERLVVIAVAAPRQIRYQRILDRKDSHRTYTHASQIRERDIAEIEGLEKGGPIAFADYTLVNEDTPDLLIASLQATLAKLQVISH